MKRPPTLPEEAPSSLRARRHPADLAEAGLASERLPILHQAEEFGASLISRPMFVVGAVPGRSWRKRPFFNADYDPVHLGEANTQGPVYGPVCRLDLVTALDPLAPPLDPLAPPLGPHAPPLPCARLQPPPPANPSSDAPPPAAGAASPSITPDALPFPQAADIDPIDQLCSLLSPLNLLGHTPSPCSAMGGSLAAGVRSEAAPCPSHPTYTPDITPLEASLTVEVMPCLPHPSLAGPSRLGTAAHVPTAGTPSRGPQPVASRAAAGAAAALPLLRATLAASGWSTSPGLTARPNAPPGTLTLARLPHPASAAAAAVDNTVAAAPAPAPAVSIGLTHHPLFLRGRLREVAGRPMTRSASSSSYFGPEARLQAPAHVPAKAA